MHATAVTGRRDGHFILKIKVYGEICCDYCNEVIHNHWDCPACNEKYASTDTFMTLHDLEAGEEVTCKCGAKFKLVSGNPYYDGEWEKV